MSYGDTKDVNMFHNNEWTLTSWREGTERCECKLTKKNNDTFLWAIDYTWSSMEIAKSALAFIQISNN